MKKYLRLFLIAIISISIVGCSNNNNKTSEEENHNQGTSESQDTIDKDQYKIILTENYEKYIKPIEIKNYEDLDEAYNEEDQIDNKQIVEDFKLTLEDNKTNLESFKDSMEILNISDTTLKELNTQLILYCDQLIENTVYKSGQLQQVQDDVLNKSNKELLDYLEEHLYEETEKEDNFESMLEEIETYVGIDLEK